LVLGLSFKIKTFYLAGGGKQSSYRGIIFNEGVLRARATVLLCKKDSETVFHLFVGCPFSNVVWEREKISLKFLGLWSGNTIPECFKNWRLQNISYPTLPISYAGTFGWKGITPSLRKGRHLFIRWLSCPYLSWENINLL
jgi:hypothetical protein